MIPDEKWIESKQVIKQIDCNKFYCYNFKILQRLGHVNVVIPFTTYSNHVLQPLYAAVINKKDFQFSVPYKASLYKMCCQGVKWILQPKACDRCHVGSWSHIPYHRQVVFLPLCRTWTNTHSRIIDGIGCSFFDQTAVFDL